MIKFFRHKRKAYLWKSYILQSLVKPSVILTEAEESHQEDTRFLDKLEMTIL